MALNHLILGTLRSLFTIGVRNLMPISQFSLSVGVNTDSGERIMSNFDFGGGWGWRLLTGVILGHCVGGLEW